MRLVFAGTPATAVPSLRALLASDHRVAAVLTRPDAPAGRGGRVSPSPVALAARDAGLRVLQPESVRSADFEAELRAIAPDAVAVVAFGALIPQRLLDIPTQGWVNLHFSLLPAWRGAAPVQAAVRSGDEITGASTFLIEKGLDTGPVFGTVTESVRPRDTAGDLLERLAVSGARLLVATMDGIADGSVVAHPQPADGVSHAAKITAGDARVDFTAPAAAVDRQVRSVTPAPGAWVASRWGRLGIGPVEPVTQPDGAPAASGGHPPRLAPGEMAVGKREVLVGTGSGPVRLGTVQAPGKRPMPAADWARGARPGPGERLGEAPAPGAPASEAPAPGAGSPEVPAPGAGSPDAAAPHSGPGDRA